ncbi:uncharacterized protein LOC111037402 [Myzus persicae]|uniref:uncharacterized protein LOC111037402 n=1 Tax=Myzus persicae TaxID=13164 RepID=UPI000B934A0B|nr:uncharacterized protein LOC111037402 [Myzus persicae]
MLFHFYSVLSCEHLSSFLAIEQVSALLSKHCCEIVKSIHSSHSSGINTHRLYLIKSISFTMLHWAHLVYPLYFFYQKYMICRNNKRRNYVTYIQNVVLLYDE